MAHAETMGALLSIACALTWAVAVVLLKHTVEKIHPLALNIFRVTFTLPLLVATSVAAGYPLVLPVEGGGE